MDNQPFQGIDRYMGFIIPFRPHFSRRIINIIPAVTTNAHNTDWQRSVDFYPYSKRHIFHIIIEYFMLACRGSSVAERDGRISRLSHSKALPLHENGSSLEQCYL